MIEQLKKYYFHISVIVIAALYFLLHRKSRQLTHIKDDVAREKVGRALDDITRKVNEEKLDYETAKKKYDDIKRIHPELYNKLR